MEYSDNSHAPVLERVCAPVIQEMRVKTVNCPCCNTPVAMPMMVDGPLMSMLEATIHDLMDKTGYTEITLRSMLGRIDQSLRQKETRDQDAMEKRKQFRVIK